MIPVLMVEGGFGAKPRTRRGSDYGFWPIASPQAMAETAPGDFFH